MQSITAQQSRDARRELGISQADVTKKLGFNRQYISEWETGHSSRLTNTQLKKLRSFYEEKITEANNNGEGITLTFGLDETEKTLTSVVQQPIQPQAAAPYRFIPFYLDVEQPVAIKTQGIIQDNDARIAVLLQQETSRNDGFFEDGELTKDTQDVLQEVFALLAVNCVLWRSLGGWAALGLSPSNESVETVRDVVFNTFRDQLEKAGLFATPSDIEEPDDDKEAAV
jgi:transcriptional regulator with XRE-family HTH domain